jgi:hypothetical protein
MRLHRRSLLLGATALGMAHANAQTVPAQPAGDPATGAASASSPPIDVGDQLADQMSAFIDQGGYAKAQERGELWVVRGTAPVGVPTSNPDWVKYRTIAYTQALLDGQADYVAEQNVRIQTETVRDFYKAANDEPPPYADSKAPGQAAELIRKLLAVGNGQLDAKLRELGVDPKQYEQTPEAQRSDLLRDHLKVKVLKHSLSDVVGLIPVQSFEGTDGAGAMQIGVVGIISSKTRDFAAQVLKSRGAFTADPAHAQDLSALLADKAGLLHDFGVRRMYDAQGLPVLVSFAQWASSYRGQDAAIAATYRDAARHQAEALADGQIADFLKATVIYDQTSTTGAELDRTATVLPDSATVSDTKNAIDELQRNIKRLATVNVTGIHTLGTWSGKHPLADHTIIGVVRVWSAASEQAIHAMQDPHPAAAQTQAAPRGPAGVTQGRTLMNASDF